MAGYYDFSKSNNAICAENYDRFPLSKASRILAKKLNWSVAKSKSFLETIGTDEYHHTSKYYNTSNYYDVSDQALSDLKDEIESFIYKPKEKEKKLFFKSWNMYDQDPRKWDWKLTSRDGNHCFDPKKIKKELLEAKKFWNDEKKCAKNKTKTRIAQENLDAIHNILMQLGES